MRRSTITGSVVVVHLTTLALVMLPPPHRSKRAPVRHEQVALQIRFVRTPQKSTPVAAPPGPSRPALPVTARSIPVAPTFPRTPSPASDPRLAISLPANVPAEASYRPGGFQTALREAQRTRPSQLPGSAGPRLAGIQLRTSPSLQATVHAMTLASRCAAEGFKLGRSAITPQSMQRLLEADGCGPHSASTPNDALIEGISQQAIFGD